MSDDSTPDLPPGLSRVLTLGPYVVGLGVFLMTSLVGVIAMWIAGNDGARWLPWLIGAVAGLLAHNKARTAIASKMLVVRELQERLAAAAARPVGPEEPGVVDVNGPALHAGHPAPRRGPALDAVTIDMTPEPKP